jgi:DNA mismatch endonuclease (patch repair protein)
LQWEGDGLAGALKGSKPISPEVRSKMMRSIRKIDTGPERTLRRLLTKLGVRYRLHGKGLPGSPDIVFRSRRKAIFVHGCFWHQHEGCALSKQPSARPHYWLPKLERNKERDRQVLEALKELGWKILVIWECELGEEPQVTKKLRSFLCNSLDRSVT